MLRDVTWPSRFVEAGAHVLSEPDDLLGKVKVDGGLVTYGNFTTMSFPASSCTDPDVAW